MELQFLARLINHKALTIGLEQTYVEYLGKLVRDEKLPKTFYKFKVRSKFAGITGLPEPRGRGRGARPPSRFW